MTQTLLTIFIPTLMVLVGILVNRGDAARIDGRISSLEGCLEGRISAPEGRLHAYILQVIGKLTELEVRVAKLEQDR